MRKSETESRTCGQNNIGFRPTVPRKSKTTRASLEINEKKKNKLNTPCTSENLLNNLQFKNSTDTCCHSTQISTKDFTTKKRQRDIPTIELKNRTTGSGKFLNSSTQWCVFHGTTTFCVVTSTSLFFPFCTKKKHLSSCLLCSKCCTKLEKFINEAKRHNCTIEKIDYPVWSNGNKEKESEKIRHVQNISREGLDSTRLSTKSSFLKDQFRVQALCGKLHRFLLTEAHLTMNLWCPFCIMNEKNISNEKHQTKQWTMSQQFNAQKLQKQLFESAKSSFLQNVQKDSRNSTLPQCNVLPPSFTKPIASLSMKFLKPSFSVNSREGSSLNLLQCENAQRNIIHSLAIKDMALYKNVTYLQASTVIRIRMAASNPASILQIADTSSVKDVQAAYRKLARLVHPDKNPHPEANAVFHTLQWAWQSLTESKRFA
ncbi:uncharacterized protein LOC128883342 isoform X5 [Hylaeus volcanicus]|uniref:uncharacterized protein LOC128883342 isoform X5 n=1 Tax=Hylaeus volcanicus TaxID=313075 RepID=UPI0023B7AD70|nr:uncharacterized protein LOC128883342 isoform X5 [Hylaeus volcanicus]